MAAKVGQQHTDVHVAAGQVRELVLLAERASGSPEAAARSVLDAFAQINGDDSLEQLKTSPPQLRYVEVSDVQDGLHEVVKPGGRLSFFVQGGKTRDALSNRETAFRLVTVVEDRKGKLQFLSGRVIVHSTINLKYPAIIGGALLVVLATCGIILMQPPPEDPKRPVVPDPPPVVVKPSEPDPPPPDPPKEKEKPPPAPPAALAYRIQAHAAGPLSLSYTADGARLATGGPDAIKVWDGATGAPLVTLPGHDRGVREAEFDARGRRLATLGQMRDVRAWDADKGRELQKFNADPDAKTWENVLALALSPDGTRVATAASVIGSDVWELRVRELVRGRQLAGHTFHATHLGPVRFSPDGRRLAVYGEGMAKGGGKAGELKGLRLLDSVTGKDVALLPYPAHAVPGDFAFNADGTRLAGVVRSTPADRVRLWHVQSGEQDFELEAPPGATLRVSFSGEGQYADALTIRLTPDKKGTVLTLRRWDVASGQEVRSATFTADHVVTAAALRPDGEAAATADDAGRLAVWELRKAEKEKGEQAEK